MQLINEGSHGTTDGAAVRNCSLTRYLFATILASVLYGCSPFGATETSREDTSPQLSPEEELETFHLAPGLTIQLVAAEPMVQDPVASVFDEDGRLWVVEMRSYMPDMDGKDERNPTGRISVLEDLDGDGRMDVSHIYLDSLIMPRAVAPVKGGVLIAYEEALWMTRDIDGDLRADERVLIDPDYAGSTLPEHAGNGLWRAIDNWYYNAKSRLRYRLDGDQWIRDSTEFRGQWGISHDDYGRLYYNYNWSQLHGDLVPPNYLNRNRNHTAVAGIDVGITLDKRVYPIRPTPAVNRGYIPGILDEEQKLREFTAACSPFIYRGTTLPGAFYGNAFVCEPSGNLIKRNVLVSHGLHVGAKDPNPGQEFLASTDERFRPVHLSQGPDGALYVTDMYRGLIQHIAYLTPYLREQTATRNLLFPIHRGRIWRIVPENGKVRPVVKLSTLSSAELVKYLSDDDGWYRDMAQRLLVERADPTVIEALTVLASSGSHLFGRLHALWTLEGMKALTPDFLAGLLGDPEPAIRNTALRLSERFAIKNKAVRSTLERHITSTLANATVQDALQIAFTASAFEASISHAILQNIVTRYDTSAIIRDAVISSLENQEYLFLQKLLDDQAWKKEKPSRQIFIEALVSAITRKGQPREVQALLNRLDVAPDEFGWLQNTILTGMAIQAIGSSPDPIVLRSEPAILRRKDLNIASSQLSALASLITWPGAPPRESAQQKSVLTEGQKEQFALGRKLYLGSCAGCHGNDGAGVTRFAPPLRKSEWVVGDEERLIRIIIHGLEGPLEVAGKRYAEPDILPVMPGHSTHDDTSIAAILTYIRNEWDNQAPPVSPATVGSVRITTGARTLPWSVEELMDSVNVP